MTDNPNTPSDVAKTGESSAILADSMECPPPPTASPTDQASPSRVDTSHTIDAGPGGPSGIEVEAGAAACIGQPLQIASDGSAFVSAKRRQTGARSSGTQSKRPRSGEKSISNAKHESDVAGGLTKPSEVTSAAPEPKPLQPGPWQAVEEAVAGISHRARGIGCQDYARAVATPRPVVVVADGAGSGSVSELGARAVVVAVTRLIDTLERQFASLLDADQPPSDDAARDQALVIVKHARGILADLAQEQRRDMRDLRCTLLVIIGGKTALMWLKVGDGALVIEHERMGSAPDGTPKVECFTLGAIGKGEYANETVFVDGVVPPDVQAGVRPMASVCGMAAMSDGAAERLIVADGTRVAARLSTLFGKLRIAKLKRHELTQMFYAPDFCERSTGDDRCIALASRPMSAVAPSLDTTSDEASP